MSRVKLQHYIPQFYLKNFASKNKKKYFINCFDKITEKQFTSAIGNIACEKYFYERGNVQPLEKELSILEKKVSKIIKKVIRTKDLNILNGSERKLMSEFIITQSIRTRESREEINDVTNAIKTAVAIHGFHMDPDEAETIIDEIYDENLVINIHKRMLSGESISRLIEPISEMIWILYLNNTEMPFWISDHPVNRYNPFNSPYGNRGLLSPGINIFFPITPKISLCLLDSVLFGEHLSNNTTRPIANIQNVIFQNHVQAVSSYKHVLSNSSNFSLLRYMLKDNPKFIKEKKRVNVA